MNATGIAVVDVVGGDVVAAGGGDGACVVQVACEVELDLLRMTMLPPP
ncbi:hypothetical protein ACO0LB_19660 [Undibacterium sp. SXout7W]